VIQSAVDAELNSSFGDISRSLGMANGGVVPSREIGNKLSIGERVGKFISKALAISIESSATKILQNLNREMQLESGAAANEGGGGGGGGLDGIDQMSSLTGIHKQAADIIAGYESATSGGYNAMNRGTAGDSPEGPMHYFGKNLTDMTIGEVMGLQSQGKLNAAGRYQFVGNTLPTAMREANLKPGDKFSPLNQDKMFVAHLIKNGHRPWTGPWGLGKYTRQQLDILDRAAKSPITGQTFSATATTANMTGVSILETSQYGWRWGRQHHGIDLQAASGWKDTIHLPVVVKRGGLVKYSGIKSKNMGMVEIQHPDGSFTRYLHLNGFKVRTGDSVRPGQIIGRLANLGESGIGNATGPHLHFEYYPPGANGPVNPKNIYSKYVSLGGTRVQPSSTPLSQLPAAPAKPTRQTPSSTSRGSGRPSLDLPGLGLKRNPRTGIWERASLAPTQSSTVASLNRSGVLKEDTSTTIYNNNAVAILPIEVGMQA
jgi:murein DD-endopeptidase MepM/ murein hydrolase activator NlpD